MGTAERRKFYVVERGPCEDCGGTGYIRNPEWSEFDKAWDAATEEERQAFCDEKASHVGGVEPPNAWDETRCGCDGGMIEREVDLETALATMGIYARRLRR